MRKTKKGRVTKKEIQIPESLGVFLEVYDGSAPGFWDGDIHSWCLSDLGGGVQWRGIGWNNRVCLPKDIPICSAEEVIIPLLVLLAERAYMRHQGWVPEKRPKPEYVIGCDSRIESLSGTYTSKSMPAKHYLLFYDHPEVNGVLGLSDERYDTETRVGLVLFRIPTLVEVS